MSACDYPYEINIKNGTILKNSSVLFEDLINLNDCNGSHIKIIFTGTFRAINRGQTIGRQFLELEILRVIEGKEIPQIWNNANDDFEGERIFTNPELTIFKPKDNLHLKVTIARTHTSVYSPGEPNKNTIEFVSANIKFVPFN